TLQTVIEAGKDIVDISGLPEDPLLLDSLARVRGVRAGVDAGVAPGCSNLIAGRIGAEWQRVDRFLCYVGGLPVVRTWPWEYKAPFSPADVVEEYTRPARYVTHGVVVSVPAMAETELIEFPAIGTLEAFITDGLRTLLRTMKAPFMQEKTMRFPGHVEKMRILREAGFFSTDPIMVEGATVRPRDLTARLLFPAWELKEGDEDFTVMRVLAEGLRDGRPVRLQVDLLDRYDPVTGTTSMARTTGYTCTALVRVLARGAWQEQGVAPPELLGREPSCYALVMDELARRGIVFHEQLEELD
ncbi:MAG: saccharopine dehydrogenase C-terminal domain-containing protein, partial [Acidobacteriota bacterium]